MNVPEVFRTSRPPLPHERLAKWELRYGQYRASERMRAARVHQAIDHYAACHVRAPINPRLP